MENCLDEDPELRANIGAFMEIGRDRNRLVHQDYGSFTLEKTAEEIYSAYLQAHQFVEMVPDCLRRFEA